MPGHVLMRAMNRLLRPLRGDWQARIQRDRWNEAQGAIALPHPGPALADLRWPSSRSPDATEEAVRR